MTPTLKNTGFKRDRFLKIPGIELSEKGPSDLLMQFPSFSDGAVSSLKVTLPIIPNSSSSQKKKGKKDNDTQGRPATPWPWSVECTSKQVAWWKVRRLCDSDHVVTARGAPGLAPPRIHLLPCPRWRQVAHPLPFCLERKHHHHQRPLKSPGTVHTLRCSCLVGICSHREQGCHSFLGS